MRGWSEASRVGCCDHCTFGAYQHRAQKKAAAAAGKQSSAVADRLNKAKTTLEVFKASDRQSEKDEYKYITMFLIPRIDNETHKKDQR